MSFADVALMFQLLNPFPPFLTVPRWWATAKATALNLVREKNLNQIFCFDIYQAKAKKEIEKNNSQLFSQVWLPIPFSTDGWDFRLVVEIFQKHMKRL